MKKILQILTILTFMVALVLTIQQKNNYVDVRMDGQSALAVYTCLEDEGSDEWNKKLNQDADPCLIWNEGHQEWVVEGYGNSCEYYPGKWCTWVQCTWWETWCMIGYP